MEKLEEIVFGDVEMTKGVLRCHKVPFVIEFKK